MASTRQTYLAVKKEATVATAVKPTHFLRYKDGDVAYNQEIIANNPIQNNRWNALNAVKGKVTTDGSYNVDLDVNECVYFLYMVLGGISSNDISFLRSESPSHIFKNLRSIPLSGTSKRSQTQ